MAPPTASGWLALLQEEDAILQEHALKQMLLHVESLWHEMAAALPDLEALAEENRATISPLAAAVASRVFFHLDESPQALKWALQAGSAYLSDATEIPGSPYVQRLVTAALDAYIEARKEDAEEKKSDEPPLIPPEALAQMVEGLVASACTHGHYRDALGLALEARQTVQVAVIVKDANSLDFTRAAVETVVQWVADKAWRAEVLALLVKALEEGWPAETACDCVLLYQRLGRPSMVALALAKLLKDENADQQLLGLQLVFDLTDAGDQAFCHLVAQEWLNAETTETAGSWTKALDQGLRVLQGGFAAELAVSFLHKQSAADRHFMESIKKALEERSSSRQAALHTAAVVTHSYLHAGTTNDSFLRDYLDWMKKASNWYVNYAKHMIRS
jgi:26S proteasome regulatory subunit N2